MEITAALLIIYGLYPFRENRDRRSSEGTEDKKKMELSVDPKLKKRPRHLPECRMLYVE